MLNRLYNIAKFNKFTLQAINAVVLCTWQREFVVVTKRLLLNVSFINSIPSYLRHVMNFSRGLVDGNSDIGVTYR